MIPVPTRRLAALTGVGALVLIPAALPLGAGLLVVDGVLLLAAVVDLVLAVAPDSIVVERELPRVLALGAEGEVVWRIRNPRDRSIRVAVTSATNAENSRQTWRKPAAASSSSWRW